MLAEDLFDDRPRLGVPAPIVLRPYQLAATQAVLAARDRGLQRALIVLPTGAGKTSCFSSLIGMVCQGEGIRTMVLAHRQELLEQAADRIRLQNPGISVGIEGGSIRALGCEDTVVAGVQTVGRPTYARLGHWKPGFLIIDEAHHAPADSYQNVMGRYGSYEGRCFTLGVTATPHRMDNKPIHGDEKAVFEEAVYTYTLLEAITQGWLCDLSGYRIATDIDLSNVGTVAGDYNQGQLARAVDTEARNLQALKAWSETASDRRTIVFCAGVDHAKHMAELFRAHGYSAESVDGAMERSQREAVISRFRSGATQILTNMDIATEGFDAPEIACVLMLRPTKSWALFCQMIGRGLRLSPGKTDCAIIDIVDNTGKHSLASLPAMLGLPPRMNLEGKSLKEAVDAFDELDDQTKTALFKRDCRYGDLFAKLTPVDLLAELEVPEEISLAGARLAWLKTGDDQYVLNVPGPERKRARMWGDALGRFSLTTTDGNAVTVHELQNNGASAFVEAETILRDVWPGALGSCMTSARWRQNNPSDKQIALLTKLGVEQDLIVQLTSGQASQLISARLAQKGGR